LLVEGLIRHDVLYILNCLHERWVGTVLLQDFFGGALGIYVGGGQVVLDLLDPV
jgi:hypothetical protein